MFDTDKVTVFVAAKAGAPRAVDKATIAANFFMIGVLFQ
jgi:hypothetical protein